LNVIGKKVVSMSLEGAGFEVIDLGTDVSADWIGADGYGADGGAAIKLCRRLIGK